MKKYKKGDIIHGRFFGNGWPFDGEITDDSSGDLTYIIKNDRTGEIQYVGGHEIVGYGLWKDQKRKAYPKRFTVSDMDRIMKIIVDKCLQKREEQCHNDRWTSTYCVFCGADNYNGKLVHEKTCVVVEAKKYLKDRKKQQEKMTPVVAIGIETDRDNLVKGIDIEGDR